MKSIKVLAAVALLVAVSAVSFTGGREYEAYYYNYDDLYDRYQEAKQANELSDKDYQAACLQADFIRYLIDHFDGETECANIGSEIEECYYEYFQDIENYGTSIKDVRELNDYYWCY